MITGHMRAWDFCRQNFMENVYDTSHEIDVFVETYNQVFRTDYHIRNENEMNVTLTDEEIKSKFNEINVVHFNIENEVLGKESQQRKLFMAYESVKKREQEFGKYDIIIRHRFDILILDKMDFNYYYEQIKTKSNLIFLGIGVVSWTDANDMSAICSSDNMKIYVNKLDEFLETEDTYCTHRSLHFIRDKYNMEFSSSIRIAIVRLGHNKEFEINY